MGRIEYNEGYYKNYDTDYSNRAVWEVSFSRIADQLIRDFNPRTVLDAGCAWGYLVEALRDRGVQAYGIDISEYAISKVREDIKPYCAVGSLSEPLPNSLPAKYDLVISIEVLEHLSAEDGDLAIKNLCALTDNIIISSTPDDFSDPTHINVQQPPYWIERFAKQGFYRSLFYDANYISNWAMRFEKIQTDITDLVFGYEHFLQCQRLQKQDLFTSKVYFNMGEGESESNVALLTSSTSEIFRHRITVPVGCRSIRLDPMEGSGCMVCNLYARSDSQSLSIVSHNGYCMGNTLLFSTIDPQMYFDLPENCHWVELSAEITPTPQAAWLELCSAIEKQQHAISQLQTTADEKDQQLQQLAERNTALSHEVQESNKQLMCEREEKNVLKQELQNYCDLTAQFREEAQKLTEDNATLSQEIEEYSRLVAFEREERDALKREIRDYSNLVAHERGEAQKVADAYARTLNSNSWKITKPIRFVMRGVKAVLRPLKKVFVSLKVNGLRTTLRKIKYKLLGKPLPEVSTVPPMMPRVAAVTATQKRSPLEGIAAAPIDPIETVIVHDSVKRLNLVTDTIDSHSLLGGVATALIVATEFANRYDYELRIITRNSDVNPTNYYHIMEISGIEPAKNVSFYSDFDRKQKPVDYKLEVTRDDIFFATSWWSAQAITATTLRPRFFYIIQEVETFFYNYGGEHLLCSQMMENPNIDYIVNSQYLYHYFQENNPHITENGCYFEPAFPEKLYHTKTFTHKSRYKLFFYARPNNPRNLYSIGVYMLNLAVERGILDTNEWDVYCVGQNAPVIQFSNGVSSINLGQLSWTEYAEFLADIDLGLCLMYTPHPSYPPFDVACSGGVVLTNKMMNKVDFPYCKNVILADLEEGSFMEAFAESIALAKNIQQRKRNYETNTICRSWRETLTETISYMGDKI